MFATMGLYEKGYPSNSGSLHRRRSTGACVEVFVAGQGGDLHKRQTAARNLTHMDNPLYERRRGACVSTKRACGNAVEWTSIQMSGR